MAEPQIWGFTRATADRLAAMAGVPVTLRPPQTQRSRQPRFVGGSGAKLVKTPGGGIAARSGTTVSSAACDETKIESGSLVSNAVSLTVLNPWPIAIPANYYIVAVLEQLTGEWIAQFPGVLNVRWVDPKLEQTSDGATYSTIDTAVNCT